MTANQIISLFLLVGRAATVALMVLVIRKQARVLHSKKYPELQQLRKWLLGGSIVILLGNLVPITIDLYGVFGKGSFSLLLAYVFSNNLTAMFSAYVMLYNLRLAERIKLDDDND